MSQSDRPSDITITMFRSAGRYGHANLVYDVGPFVRAHVRSHASFTPP